MFDGVYEPDFPGVKADASVFVGPWSPVFKVPFDRTA